MIGRAFIATFRAVLADRSAFMLIVVSTILYSFFYPSAYSGEVAVRIPVAVVDLDNTGASRSLVHKLSGLQQADLVARLPSPKAADDWLRTRGAGAIVVVPAGFERRILTGGQGTVALYGNGAYLLRSSTALARPVVMSISPLNPRLHPSGTIADRRMAARCVRSGSADSSPRR